MATRNSKLSDDQRVDLAIELVRASNLLDLATPRAECDSHLLALLNAVQDRVRAISQILGFDLAKELGIERPAAGAAAEAQVSQ